MEAGIHFGFPVPRFLEDKFHGDDVLESYENYAIQEIFLEPYRFGFVAIRGGAEWMPGGGAVRSIELADPPSLSNKRFLSGWEGELLRGSP